MTNNRFNRTLVFLLLFVTLTFFFGCNNEKRDYETAVDLFHQQRYSEAYEIFDSLGDFRDSRIYGEKCIAFVTEERYQDALQKINHGNVKEGIEILNTIPTYKEAEAYLKGYDLMTIFAGQWMATLPVEKPHSSSSTVKHLVGEVQFKVEADANFSIAEADSSFDYEVVFPIDVNYSLYIKPYYATEGYTEKTTREMEARVSFDIGKDYDIRVYFFDNTNDLLWNLLDTGTAIMSPIISKGQYDNGQTQVFDMVHISK